MWSEREDLPERKYLLFLPVTSAKNLNTPNWSYMADDANTRGVIEVLVSLFYKCGLNMQSKILCLLG